MRDKLREACEDWLWGENLLDSEEPDRASSLRDFVRSKCEEATHEALERVVAACLRILDDYGQKGRQYTAAAAADCLAAIYHELYG